MIPQPTPTVNAEDVVRVVRRDYPADKVPEVLAILNEYGAEHWHCEPHRVRLAALKLAAGSLEQLRIQIDSAKCDFRDVLAYAEYPGYMKKMFHIEKVPENEQKRVIDADWSQYQEWLKG